MRGHALLTIRMPNFDLQKDSLTLPLCSQTPSPKPSATSQPTVSVVFIFSPHGQEVRLQRLCAVYFCVHDIMEQQKVDDLRQKYAFKLKQETSVAEEV